MAAVTCLDTHVVVALAMASEKKLSAVARRAVESDTLRLSPMVYVELAFLYEIGRLDRPPSKFLGSVMDELGILWCEANFLSVSQAAESLSWTRDPFDRVIVAHAQAEKARLVTKDELIRKHYKKAVW